MYIKEIYSKYW